MGVFVVLALHQSILTVVVLVLQLARDRPGTARLHIRNGRVDGIMGTVGLGTGGHQNDGICQREPCFRQAHHVGGINCRLHNGDDLWIGKTHILAGTYHQATAGRGQISCFQQTGQIMQRRIRVGAAHGLLVG